ncbi:MAG: DUF3990 domain-containing protein [Saccharofermentans sp.]|nr:DUF3990 domain-containing protein [Saccharofermentans sp.]
MHLYHGSQRIVEQPVYGFGKPENDYGLGFYCTESKELAKEWACPINNDGYANEYELDLDGFKVLNLNTDKYHILNWLALLLKNRKFDLSQNKTLGIRGRQYNIENFLPNISGYDVIIGYRADDRYFAFAKDFIQGGLSLNQLANSMRLGELGEQVVLISPKAFEQIKFIGYEISDSSIYYMKKIERENRANDAFNRMHESESFNENDLYIIDILREEVKTDDPRLR